MPKDDALTVPAKPALKCPGWFHQMDTSSCDLDRKTHAWLSRRRETTHSETEAYRQDQHSRAGFFAPEVEDF